MMSHVIPLLPQTTEILTFAHIKRKASKGLANITQPLVGYIAGHRLCPKASPRVDDLQYRMDKMRGVFFTQPRKTLASRCLFATLSAPVAAKDRASSWAQRKVRHKSAHYVWLLFFLDLGSWQAVTPSLLSRLPRLRKHEVEQAFTADVAAHRVGLCMLLTL